MSTRSNIAIELPDGKVKAIYVHSDGYPNGVGHCLLQFWRHEINAKKLRTFWKTPLFLEKFRPQGGVLIPFFQPQGGVFDPLFQNGNRSRASLVVTQDTGWLVDGGCGH